MSEILALGDGSQHAISVNSERGPTMIWRDGDTVTLVMRMFNADDGVSLSRIKARIEDLGAKARHDYHMQEVFSPICDEGRTWDPGESDNTSFEKNK